MKALFLSLILTLTLVGFHGGGTASAASAGVEAAAAQSTAPDAAELKAQYGGGGGGYDDGYRRRGYDDDSGRERYRGRREWDPRGRREYCWSCARRCEYDWCPPRCWNWWRYCRRDY